MLSAATTRAGFFTGEFAPANWTFSGTAGDIIWDPPANPSSVSVYSPLGGNSITTLALNPISGSYVVSFRATFNAMTSPSAELKMNAPGYVDEIIGLYPGGPQTVVKTYTLTMGPTDSILFALTADNTGIGDKKNVAFFTIDSWDVQVIPEASTVVAAMGLLALCGFHVWRSRRNTLAVVA
jgi:hypothetical protein